MKGTLFCGLFFAIICVIECYTEEDIQACRDDKFGVIVCTSVSFYRECVVPGAVQVHAIKLNKNFTRALCEFKNTFGYRGNAIWVSGGCSGEFFLCYDGAPMPGTKPVTSVPVKPTERDVAVISASSIKENDIWIYVIVAVGVVLLVGIGLIVGCVVKRRQQNDKSRQLAEKRQIRIELKEHRENMEENGVTMVPIANRSLSLESINYGDSINYSYGSRYENEKEGSVCSSRSSNSGMTSMSARTTGYLMKTRPSIHGSMTRMPSGKLKKGISTPDISVLGKMYCDANMNMNKYHRGSLRRQSKNSLARGSQSSLESVREVCDKYQVFDIPLEKKLMQPYRRPSKYNTVSFGVGSSQRIPDSRIYSLPETTLRKNSSVGFTASAHEQAYRYSMRSLPGSSRNSSRTSSRRVTKAIVHSRSPSVKDIPACVPEASKAASNISDNKTQHISKPNQRLEQPLKTKPSYEIPRDTQYHDPTSLIVRPSEPKQRLNVKVERSESPVSVISKAESIYEIVDKLKVNKPALLPKPKILPKPSNAIYATVNKSYFKAALKAEKKDDVMCSTFDVMSMEDDEDDAVVPERESQYARLEAFKSASTLSVSVSTISLHVPGVSTDDTKI